MHTIPTIHTKHTILSKHAIPDRPDTPYIPNIPYHTPTTPQGGGRGQRHTATTPQGGGGWDPSHGGGGGVAGPGAYIHTVYINNDTVNYRLPARLPYNHHNFWHCKWCPLRQKSVTFDRPLCPPGSRLLLLTLLHNKFDHMQRVPTFAEIQNYNNVTFNLQTLQQQQVQYYPPALIPSLLSRLMQAVSGSGCTRLFTTHGFLSSVDLATSEGFCASVNYKLAIQTHTHAHRNIYCENHMCHGQIMVHAIWSSIR